MRTFLPISIGSSVLLSGLLSLASIVLVTAGCSSHDDVLVSSDGTSAARALDGGNGVELTPHVNMDGSIALRAALDATLAVDAPSADAGEAPSEICDGIDNDGDGIVDNLDVGHDGICDCLRLATLGVPGTFGKGNVFGSWLNTRSNTPAVALGGMVLTPALLAQFQIIVAEDLHGQRAYAKDEIDALEAWVRAGGGLMTLVGYGTPTERTNVNAVLARFGTNYGDKQILIRTSGTASSVPVTTWLGPHPVIQGVTRLGFDNGYATEGNGTTLAQGAGYDLLKVQEVGMGHLIVWGDEWITYDSEWSDHPDYQVAQFWVNSIKWLTVERVCQVPPTFL